MVALWNRADHYIFALWFLLSFFLLSFPRLISAVAEGMSAILPHVVWLSANFRSGLKRAAHGSLQIQDAKKSPKIAMCAPSHNFIGPHLRN